MRNKKCEIRQLRSDVKNRCQRSDMNLTEETNALCVRSDMQDVKYVRSDMLEIS